jgi:hypothetical protein
MTVMEPLVTYAPSSSNTNALSQNPFFALSTKIAKVYGDALRQNMEHLTVSSAKIIQQQTIQAWTKNLIGIFPSNTFCVETETG